MAASSASKQYFVSPTGSNQNAGTIERPFQSIQKCADRVQPGETCVLRAGLYRETVRPALSGTALLPISFVAYKNEEVTVSGADPVNKWIPFQNSIFRAQASLPIDGYNNTGFLANQIFVNGKMMPEARWPNTGFDPMRPTLKGGSVKGQGGTAATVENTEIPDLPEGWAGATVWTNEWYVSRTGTITGGGAGKLTAEMTAAWDRGGFWFFLIGKLGLLDSEGEWFYDGKDKTLYLWAPGGEKPQLVEVKQRNYAFDLTDRSYITLRNIKIFASTITTSDASQGVTIDGLNAEYVSHHITLPPLPQSEKFPNSDDGLIVASHAHDTGIQLRGVGHTFKNSTIRWSSGNGILLKGRQHRVENSSIENSNYMSSYAAPVRINGTGHQVIRNTIKGAGRDGINIDWHTAGYDASNIEIAFNNISDFGLLSTDLGAIYICCDVSLEGGSIHHNQIHNANAFSPFWGTRGIYLDLDTYNSTIHHNVIWNINGGKDSFYLTVGSKRGYNRVFNNTVLGPVSIDGSVEARNNIFTASTTVDTEQQSNNLFSETNPKFSNPATSDFTLRLDSPAIDQGRVLPGITEDVVGKTPDIGAYESGAPIWNAGSDLSR
ncbi:MAG: right-handed parallel beta-helix repeat-containing protein [Thermosynechococcaceae cyanobacterium]